MEALSDGLYWGAVFFFVAWAATMRAGPPPPHGVAAANLRVVQNDTGNTPDSVTVTPMLSVNDLRVRPGSNRGDYNVQVGDSGADDMAAGLVMVAVAENGRDNGELENLLGFAAPAFDSGAAGYWAVVQDITGDRAEYNMDVAVAYFRYSDWLAGWARNNRASNGATNNLLTGSPGLVLGTHFAGISAGRSRVDLRSFGIHSTNSGVLLVNHGKNEGNYATSVANPDGTWEVYVRDNFGSATNPRALEQDPAAFVFIPRTNTTVVSGKFGVDATGTNATILMHSGDAPRFAVSQLEPGRFRLTIPGATPSSGILITSTEGGYTNNFDNVVSYQADGSGWLIEARDTGVYPPPLEGTTNEPVASFVFIPAATPGMSAAPARTLVTTEGGGTASFGVVLDLAPSSAVTLSLRSTAPAEAAVTPSEVTLGPDNWNVPQPVTVAGLDDAATDGPVTFEIVATVAAGSDAAYVGVPDLRVAGVNIDDESPSIVVTPFDGLVLRESGGEATVRVRLNRAPSSPVRVPVASATPTEASAVPAELEFTPANWNVEQVVTLRGVDDARQDGARAFDVQVGPSASNDGAFSGILGSSLRGVNEDDDVVGIRWTYSLPLTVVESRTVAYSVALGTQPDAPVVFQVASSASNVVQVTPPTLVFTPEDWQTPRVVTLTAADNATNQPTFSLTITNTLQTLDPVYTNFVGATTLPAVVLDNETGLVLPSDESFHGVGMPPMVLEGNATLLDPDATTFPGGRLEVTILNAAASDRLSLRVDPNRGLPVALDGAVVLHEGRRVGTLVATGPSTLMVDWNAEATVGAVQAVLRSVAFETTDFLPERRRARVAFSDGMGATTAVEKALRVGWIREVQFQEGADHGYGIYRGAADIALSQVGSGTPWPVGRTPAPAEGLLMDWPDGGTPNESQILMRFDGLVGTNAWQVPPGAQVVLAELVLFVNNPGDGARLHRMLVPWDAEGATWDLTGNGVAADDVEARSTYESQLGLEDGSGSTGLGVVKVGVTPDVQAWVAGETNHGWVFLGWPLRTDGTGISPSEAAAVEERPRLRVLWTLPTISQASFQQGVNGYAGAKDTLLRQTEPDTVLGAFETLWADWPDGAGTNAMHSLIRFEHIFGAEPGRVPSAGRVHLALLDLPSVGPDNMGDGGRLHRMLADWDDQSATWNSMVGGISADGVEAAVDPSVTVGSLSLEPDVQATWTTVDVTEDVRAWQSGAPNKGWALLPLAGGVNGWGFRSSDFASFVDPARPEGERPRLRVFHTLTVPSTPATLATPTVAGGNVRIGFQATPGARYRVLRATTLGGQETTVAIITPDAAGLGTFQEPASIDEAAFYRVVSE